MIIVSMFSIQVIAPNDVQFHLPTLADEEEVEEVEEELSRTGTIPEASFRGPQEVIINTNNVPAESLCVDTMAFVGATITFIMILVIALITIIFLWMRIRSMTGNGDKSKQLLHQSSVTSFRGVAYVAFVATFIP